MYFHLCRIFILVLISCSIIYGDVTDSSEIGFTSENTVIIKASPDAVYKQIIKPGDWWNPEHTYSGNSGNLFIEDKIGGCFCEKLANNSDIRHLEVIYREPGKILRLSGGLGPLQSMAVSGVLTFTLSETAEGTKTVLNYTAGGYTPGGLKSLAPIVDMVMALQLNGLKDFIESAK